jgi:hypothetical protein
MADDGGVLGNLPRSRPGQRSEKRTGRAAAEAAAPKERAQPGKTAGARPSGGGARRQAAGARASTGAPPKQPASHAGDPVGDAIRTVTGVAATGARVAGGVAREVLRRLPRP